MPFGQAKISDQGTAIWTDQDILGLEIAVQQSLLVSGILRVIHFGQGSEFYTQNPLFWWKVGLYLSVGGLSLYPTVTYILWAIPLRKGELPKVSEALATRLSWIINIELVGFASIPFMATLMARGVGLPAG